MRLALKVIFAAWVTLWLIFAARDMFYKTNFRDYKALISRSLEGKRSYIIGDGLYKFIEFCRKETPEGSAYGLEGIEKGEVDRVRVVYYLYPRIESADHDYIFVYNLPAFTREGFMPYKKLDDGSFILKKVSERRP